MSCHFVTLSEWDLIGVPRKTHRDRSACTHSAPSVEDSLDINISFLPPLCSYVLEVTRLHYAPFTSQKPPSLCRISLGRPPRASELESRCAPNAVDEGGLRSHTAAVRTLRNGELTSDCSRRAGAYSERLLIYISLSLENIRSGVHIVII